MHDPCAQPEHVAHVGMHGEIGVALPVPQLRIGQLAMLHTARVFLPEGERPERLGQQRESRDAQRDLARTRLHQTTLDAEMIAQVEQLYHAVLVRSQLIALEIELDLARRILQMRERGPPVRPQRHESPSERILRLVILGAVRRQRRLRRRAAIEAIGKRCDAALDELFQLLTPRGLDKSGHLRCLAPEALQKRLDEWVEVAVHDFVHVAHLQLGAVVVHHRVRLEDI